MFLLTEGEQLARLDRHQCIVVVMMENRSYDHMLGDLMHVRPDPENPYDGAPLGVKDAGVHGFVNGVPLVRTRDLRIGTAIPVSPAHSFNATEFQIGDGTQLGRGTGDMLGFARDLYRRSDSPQQALTVYGEAELPTYYKLADEFCTCERWFAAHPGPTWPNRFATLMGKIPELENFHLDDPRIGYIKDRNIFDALSGARIEWRLFESDLSIIRMFDRFRLDSTNVVPMDDPEVGFEATLRRQGALPRVMFVEPNFADIPPLKTADDDHPPADIQHGQKFISRVCDLLWDTGRFDEVLLVITYDEHGGFYDHVAPPGTARGEQRSFAKLHPDGPNYLGVRVPAFVVSPYVSAGAKNRTVFDHTSILKTILVHNRERLSDDVLLGFGERVNEAQDLSAVLDLLNARPSPEPFVRRRTRATPPRFGTSVDLSTLLDLTASVEFATADVTPASGVTPREMSISERTVPPGASFEADDFHGALYKLMRPRKL
jgi:phospholipase C